MLWTFLDLGRDTCTPTYLLVDHFGLESHREVFTPNSSIFLFDNTSPCYLGFESLFPIALYMFTSYLFVHPCNC